MAKIPASIPVVQITPQLVKLKVEGIRHIAPLKEDVTELEITDEETYKYADGLLARINAARTWWADKFTPIAAPIERAMMELKASLKASKALSDEVEGPLVQLYNTTRDKMRVYKLREAEQIRAAAAAQEQETKRLAEAAKRIEARLASAPKAQQTKLVKQLEVVATQQQETAASVPEAVKGATSLIRHVKKWRVKDMENGSETVLRAVLAGKIPPNVLALNDAYVGHVFRENPDTVASWPGFEVYDDIVIAGKR